MWLTIGFGFHLLSSLLQDSAPLLNLCVLTAVQHSRPDCPGACTVPFASFSKKKKKKVSQLRGCLLAHKSYFHNDPNNFSDVGGGVLGGRGFHSSFRTTQDVSTTMIIQPGPVVDFLIANQSVRDPFSIDWVKAKRTLKNLRIKASPTNQEYKITGLSERPCKDQTFTLKQRGQDNDAEPTEVTVYDYFVTHRNINLRYSGDLPCIDVGRPKRPTYIPLELCSLLSLQQRSSLVEKSRQKTQERMTALTNALKIDNYDAEPLLQSCGVSINTNFTTVEGRVLPAPRLGGEDLFPGNGRWNLLHKAVEPPTAVFEESQQFRRAPPLVRVEKMFEEVQSKLPSAPKFLLCLLPERKNTL